MEGFGKHTIRNSRTNIFFFAFLILYAGTLIYLSYAINIWVDEAYTLNTTSRGFFDVIHQSYNFEAQLPLYFVLLSLWRDICADVFFARLFSLIFVALAAWIFSRLVQLLSGNKNSQWMVVVFLMNPFTIWAALEIRLYAFLLFLSITTVYFFIRFFYENKTKYLYYFLCTSLLGLFTQYFFAGLIASMALAILLFKGLKAGLKFCLSLLPVVLLFLPNLLMLPEQLKISESKQAGYHFSEKFMAVFINSPLNLMLGTDLMPFGRILKMILVFIFILAVFIAYYLWYKNAGRLRQIHFRRLNLSVFIVAVLILLISLIFSIARLDFHDRYLTTGFAMLLIIFSVFYTYPRSLQRLAFGSLSLLFAFLVFLNYRHPVKEYDYPSISKYISDIEFKNEPILFYHATLSLPFSYYYKGQNPLIPLPHEVHFDATYMDNVQDTFQLKESLNKINTTSRSYLLVSDYAQRSINKNENREMVNNYLSLHYQITLDTLYKGRSKDKPLRIMRLQKFN